MLRAMKIRHRLALLIAFFSVSFLVYGGSSYLLGQEIEVGGPVFSRIIQANKLVADVAPPAVGLGDAYQVCLELALSTPGQVPPLVARFRQLEREYSQRRAALSGSLDGELAALFNGPARNLGQDFFRLANQAYLPAVLTADQAALPHIRQQLGELYDQHQQAVARIVALAGERNVQDLRAAAARRQFVVKLQVAVLLGTLTVAILFAIGVGRSITQPLTAATRIARKVAAGDLCLGRGSTYHDEPGQLITALSEMSACLARYMQELEQSERGARQAHAVLERVIETANVMVVGLDSRRRIALFNAEAELVTGLSRSEALGCTWEELHVLVAPESWQIDVAELVNMPLEHRQELLDRDGRRRAIAWRNSVVPAPELTLISVGIDITEQLASEQAAMAAKRMAEESNRSKSAFLANMSHEIRTPMNAVIGMTALVLRTELQPQQRRYLEKVSVAARGLLGIINDVLDYSKIEAGKLDFEQREFPLDQVLDRLSALLGMAAEEKQLELLFDVSPEVPAVLVGDELRLGQVLLNLMGNAIKFTAVGEVVLRIGCTAREEQSVALRFEVIDTGIGIPPDQLGRLFTPFEQADASTTRNFGGTGLGLSISRRLVLLMGGEISADSVPGQGSRFGFTARFGLAPGQSWTHAAARAFPAWLRTLVVDDNAVARGVLQDMLAAAGVQSDSVGDGEAALAMLDAAQQRGQPYHVVLLDWRMPQLDGVETLRRLRGQDGTAETLVVVLASAFGREQVLAQADGLRLEGVLEKPVLPAMLEQVLADLLSPAARTVAPAAPQPNHQRLQGRRILLVEDNEINQELAIATLEQAGLQVDLAGNGIEALQRLQQASYDAVLMDWHMPLMDGFEATRRIRAMPHLAKLPILAMTANAMSGDREQCLAVGMNDHIAKPLDINTVLATLERWIAPAELASHGFDMEGALRRLRGNRQLYRRLLGLFVEQGGEVMHRLREAWAHGDHALLIREAHMLRGVAANVGAVALARQSGAVEQAAEGSGQGRLPGLLDELAGELQAALHWASDAEQLLVAASAGAR